MFISPGDYALTFERIKRTSLSHSTCKLIIFVLCLNIDALCSAKIFSLLLKKELIQYQLIPVVGYTDLKEHFLKLDLGISNVILLGCGAMLDLEAFFEIEEAESEEEEVQEPSSSRKIYILDGRRPWNLDNLFASKNVVCFDDGYIDANLAEEKAAYQKLVEFGDSDEEEEDDSDDSEDENEDAEDEIDQETNDSNDETSNNSNNSIDKKRKRDHPKSARKLRRKERHDSEMVIESYYSQGSSIITSTTAIIYLLLSFIGETSIDFLWLAILGTSSLDSHFPQVYDKIEPLFRDEVMRLSPPQDEHSADTSTLNVDQDYHLFLLRHWNLYDAFFYLSHVNAKLNLWTEDGKKKLHKLFAKMGILLAVAQQNWLYLDIGIKKQLPTIFTKYLPLYGLEGVVREGFIRVFGYQGQLSAMECVELLTALLEFDRRVEGISNSKNNYRSAATGGEAGGDEKINSLIEKREKLWVNNFWSSWDALNLEKSPNKKNNNNGTIGDGGGIISLIGIAKKPKGLGLLMSGLEKAKELQQVIFRTGMSLLERKQIRNLKLYRLCVLTEGSIPDLHLFNNPLILSKLGLWLLDSIAEIEFTNSKTSTLKPLVVAGLDTVTDTYLVIGLAPKYPRGMTNTEKSKLFLKDKENGGSVITRLNTFSVAFQRVASTAGAKVRIDSFDSTVIEIRKDDLSPFLERLTLSGLL